MNWATAVFLIVAMALSIPLLRIWTTQRRRLNKHDAERDQAGAVELAELRERVNNLERIVTDEGYRLDREFKHLDNGDAPASGADGGPGTR